MIDKKVVFRDHKPFFCEERNDGSGGFNMEIDSLLPYFNYEIELEPGTLFDDFWNLIIRDIDVYNSLFSGIICNQDLNVYANQFKKPSIDDEVRFSKKYRIEYFEISPVAEINIYEEDDICFDFGFDFCGRGLMEGAEGDDYIGYYGVSFMPINDWKGYELRINNTISIKKYDMSEKSKNIPFDEKNFYVVKEAKYKLTVYDAIHAILNELSWCGYPEDQMKRMQEIEQSIEEAKRAFKNTETDKEEPDIL
jgi:hypothetical protein